MKPCLVTAVSHGPSALSNQGAKLAHCGMAVPGSGGLTVGRRSRAPSTGRTSVLGLASRPAAWSSIQTLLNLEHVFNELPQCFEKTAP